LDRVYSIIYVGSKSRALKDPNEWR
jgi:hypothetical protein